MSAFLSSGSGYALDEEGMRQCCNERCAHSISMAVPMGGHWCPHMSHNAAVAFSPVVAMARHWGMASSSLFMSEYFTTSRYLSLALSLRRIASQAVSYRAIPFCARNAVMASLATSKTSLRLFMNSIRYGAACEESQSLYRSATIMIFAFT